MASNWDTYLQGRQQEDVEDMINVISPIDNPITSMSKNVRATSVLHQFSQDQLKAPASNKAVEGADAIDTVPDAIHERDQYCQIMTKVTNVSETMDSVSLYGRNEETSYQLELRYSEMANDYEHAIAGAPGGTRQTKEGGATGATARTFASIHNQFAVGVQVDATLSTTLAALEDDILSAHQATYTAGGNPSYLISSVDRVRHISGLAYAAGRQRDIQNERTIVNTVDLYVSNFGELDVVISRHQDPCYLLLDFNYCANAVLRPTQDWPLAKTGDSTRRQIVREGAFCLLHDESGAMVDNVQETVTTS